MNVLERVRGALSPRRAVLAGGIVAVLAAVSIGLAVAAAPTNTVPAAVPPMPSAAPDLADAGALQNPVASSAESDVPADAVPTRLRIPALDIDTRLDELEYVEGALLAPADWKAAGWFAQGVVPGRIGPAILAAHVDDHVSPALFFHLSELEAGDEVIVDLSTGQRVHFEVSALERARKANFPTSDVYGNVPTPELRLITCDGPIDPRTGLYRDNLIVTTDLVAIDAP